MWLYFLSNLGEGSAQVSMLRRSRKTHSAKRWCSGCSICRSPVAIYLSRYFIRRGASLVGRYYFDAADGSSSPTVREAVVAFLRGL